jgi:hypothetical protein
MTVLDVNKMTGDQLVAEYNAKSGKKPIKRFGTIAEGQKRVKALRTTSDKPKEKGLVGEFGVRGTTNRAKLLRMFDKAGLNKPVKENDMMRTLYRSADKKWKAAFGAVIISLNYVIKQHKLSYHVKKIKDKETKEVTYALVRR